MNEGIGMLGAAAAGGLVLGALFYGGLWFTVSRVVASDRPFLWLGGSFLLRTGLAVTGFYFVSAGRWERLLACLAGFVVARLLLSGYLKHANFAPHRGRNPCN